MTPSDLHPTTKMPHERLRPGFAFTAERIEELRRVVPEAFADGKVNWTALREALGDWTEDEGDNTEHFGLTWPGKRDARRMAALPSQGTLVPMPGEGVDEETTKNIFIEGDNLEVLKLLQKSYAGRVKMIYIDPPYNTGNDFIYEDDFKEPIETYLRRTGQLGEDDKPLSTNTRADGRFHSKWLSMMYPRLLLARRLLADDGVMFVSIDDNESANLRILLDSVFGPENHLGTFIWRKKYTLSFTAEDKISIHEYIHAYRRSSGALDLVDPRWTDRKSVTVSPIFKAQNARSTKTLRAGAKLRERGNFVVPSGPHRLPSQVLQYRQAARFVNGLLANDVQIEAGFAVGQQTLDEMRDRITVSRSGAAYLDVQNEEKRIAPLSILLDYTVDDKDELYQSYLTRKAVSTRQATDELQRLLGAQRVFDNPKPSALIKYLIGLLGDTEALVLDFFAGSGSTAHAVLSQNREDGGTRNYIAVQLPERTPTDSAAAAAGFKRLSEITKARLRAVSRDLRTPSAGELRDVGFKAMALKPSNFSVWENYAGDNLARLEGLFAAAEQTLKAGWTDYDVVVEVMLMEGFPLDSTIVETDASAVTLRRISAATCAHELVICLAPRISTPAAAAVKLDAKDVFVCLDGALTDEAKLRLADRCLLKTI